MLASYTNFVKVDSGGGVAVGTTSTTTNRDDNYKYEGTITN